MILIATRRYVIENHRARRDYLATDSLYRREDGFVLKLTTNGHPEEPDTEEALTLEQVHYWLREWRWQIKRAVYSPEVF
jgi:hypothetical protein